MNISSMIFIGGGLLLLLAIMVVFLETAYDAGFEDGFDQGRATPPSHECEEVAK